MTVAELIAALRAFPEEQEVFLSGYEADYDRVDVVRPAFLHERPDKIRYEGTHREGVAPWPPGVILEHDWERRG